MNKYMVYTLWIIALYATIITLDITNISLHRQLIQARHQYETEQICNYARAVEEFNTCYDLETKYHVEYICTANLQCGVEIK